MNVVEAARGKWHGILSRLGIAEHFLNKKHHPCPGNGQGKDRFRWTDYEGKGCFVCKCSEGEGSGFDLLSCCYGWSFAEAAKQVEKIVGTVDQAPPPKPQADPAIRLRKIMEESRLAVDGTVVWEYLGNRGLRPPACLREAEVMYYDDGKPTRKYTCMIARVMTVDGLPATLHCTYLENGKKADVPSPRKLLPKAKDFKGGAVRLFKEGPTLGIAEGIETALAAAELYRMPVWASLNAGNLQDFQPPPGTKKVIVFADRDESFTGQAAGYTLAKKLHAKGLECEVFLPSKIGDWCDVLQESRK
jgi:putative DNA primase/helicase